MTIREYRPSDCPAMAQLFYDTVHSVNARDYNAEQLDAWATGTVDLEGWNASFLAHRTLVAEVEGVLAGFADMTAEGYLDRLYVHRDCQGQGIATALCEALEAPIFGVVTTHASITARPFFEHRGYRVVRQQEVVCRGVAMTNFVMEKRREFTREELTEARRQIDSTLHKLRETVKTLEEKENPTRLKAQITLAKRRITAFSIANALIDEKLEEKER